MGTDTEADGVGDTNKPESFSVGIVLEGGVGLMFSFLTLSI